VPDNSINAASRCPVSMKSSKCGSSIRGDLDSSMGELSYGDRRDILVSYGS